MLTVLRRTLASSKKKKIQWTIDRPEQELYVSPSLGRYRQLINLATVSQGVFWSFITYATLTDFGIGSKAGTAPAASAAPADSEGQAAATGDNTEASTPSPALAETATPDTSKSLMFGVSFAAAGILFISSMQLWASGIVTRMTLLRGGRDIVLETCALLPKRQKVTYPVDKLWTATAVSNPAQPVKTGWIYLNMGHTRRFMLDKDGKFHAPKEFDTMFLNNKN